MGFDQYSCKHFGCPAKYVAEDALRKHEAKPHYQCSCGRFFTAGGIPKHLAQLRRRNVPHPPYPAKKE